MPATSTAVGSALVTDLVPEAGRGRALALLNAATWLGAIVGLWTTGSYLETIRDNLPDRYDALLSFDTTRALSPLHLEHALPGEVPETYPSGV